MQCWWCVKASYAWNVLVCMYVSFGHIQIAILEGRVKSRLSQRWRRPANCINNITSHTFRRSSSSLALIWLKWQLKFRTRLGVWHVVVTVEVTSSGIRYGNEGPHKYTILNVCVCVHIYLFVCIFLLYALSTAHTDAHIFEIHTSEYTAKA